MTKFKVGDKVRVINAEGSGHTNGDIGEVVAIDPPGPAQMFEVDVAGFEQVHYAEDIELVTEGSE